METKVPGFISTSGESDQPYYNPHNSTQRQATYKEHSELSSPHVTRNRNNVQQVTQKLNKRNLGRGLPSIRIEDSQGRHHKVVCALRRPLDLIFISLQLGPVAEPECSPEEYLQEIFWLFPVKN